jgi:16S rRNA (uracil1498-N3)-methyltransferase
VHRFFTPSLDPGDETVTLPRDEADHLIRVLRIGVGDTVSVFDGRGREFLARVISADRHEARARVQIVSSAKPADEPSVSITLAQSVLKGEAMDDVVRDAVMMGAVAIQPVVTKRTEVTVAALTRGARVDRWKRVALASVKQSGRAVLPEIRPPLTLESVLDEPRTGLILMLVEPRAAVPSISVSALRGQPVPSEATILVGPEGGWTEEECAAAARQGVQLVTLGRRTLRADAAPVAAISVLQFLWGDL